MANVFLVEDNADMLFTFELMLKYNNFEIMGTAQDGDEAIEKYKEFSVKPDFVLLDHRMPKKDGLEVMNELLKVNSSVIIIFISADHSIKAEALSKGARAFLKKPVNEEMLIDGINKVLKVA